MSYEDREIIRKIYMAFKVGALLKSQDVERLLAGRGIKMSSNRLRELGRNSDRGHPIAAEELYHLVSAWADEQREVARATV